MSKIDPGLVDRLHLTPELIAKIDSGQPRLASALLTVLSTLGERTIEKIVNNIIDDPVVHDRGVIESNPFFQDYPRLRRPYGDKTLLTLNQLMSDRYEAYELGLLAYLIDDFPRARNDRSGVSIGERKAESFRRIATVVASDVYRPLLVDILERMSSPEWIQAMSELTEANQISFADGAALNAALLKDVALKMARKSGNKRARWHAIGVITFLVEGIVTSPDLEEPIPRFLQTTDQFVGGTQILTAQFSRPHVVRALDELLAPRLGLRENTERYTILVRSIYSFDPLPISRVQFISGLGQRLASLLAPYRSFDRSPGPSPAAHDVSHIAPSVYRVVDHFEPRKHNADFKPVTDRAAFFPSPEIRPWRPDDITPERALTAFTKFSPRPREIDGLRANQDYEFWYRRELNPVLRHVRISAEAVFWMQNHRTEGLRILNALHMGESNGSVAGIRLILGARRADEDEPVYEIKIHGSFRALMILVNGTWEILKVVHKDHLFREARLLGPIKN